MGNHINYIDSKTNKNINSSIIFTKLKLFSYNVIVAEDFQQVI